jgi:hypothetical protein
VRLADLRPAPGRVVDRQAVEFDGRSGPGDRQHQRRQLGNRPFARIAEVHRPLLGRIEHGHDAADEIVDVAEAAGLAPVAVNGQRVAVERLGDETRDHPAVVRAHARAVGVEDPQDSRVDAERPPISHRQRFGEPLRFVVDAAGTDRVDVPPVVLALRMHGGIAVNLAGRREDETSFVPLGQPKRVLGAATADRECFQWTLVVVRRRGRTGEVRHHVHRPVDLEESADVAVDEFESRQVEQVLHIGQPAGRQVVHADDRVTSADEEIADVGAEKTGSSGHDNARHNTLRDRGRRKGVSLGGFCGAPSIRHRILWWTTQGKAPLPGTRWW